MTGAKPLIIAAMGGRGTGKSAWVRQTLKRAKPTRLAVWDLMKEHADLGQATDNLGEAIRAMRARRFAVVFNPSRRDDDLRARQFDLWCSACMQAGNLVAYVEELAFVTTASRAPPGWKELCLLGRHADHRVTIIGTSQRPAQIDKEFLCNADLLHCGRQGEEADARRVAGRLGVHFLELQQLPDLAWIERGTADTEPRRGKIIFAGAGQAAAPPKGGQPKAKNLQRAKGAETVGAGEKDATDKPNGAEP